MDVLDYLKVLGWTKSTWDSQKKPMIYTKFWKELKGEQRQSALKLGFSCKKWNSVINEKDYMKGWTEHYDSSGTVYYFNKKTQESRWDEPLPKGCSKPVFSAGGTSLTADEIMNRLFTDVDNSPIFEESEDNPVMEYIEKKMDEYLESNSYYDKFLRDLCKKKNGRWIDGGSFGRTETSFDRGSKCSYKTRKDCDNSYNWSVFKKDEDIDKKAIPSLAKTNVKKLVDKALNDVKKMKNSFPSKKFTYNLKPFKDS